MNSKPLVAFLVAVGLSGCVVYSNNPKPPPAQPGDVTFTWSFAGKTCNEVPQVKSVVVTIDGERLQNDGVFPCLANNYPGIVLHDFRPGTYSFTLDAIGYGNEALFSGASTFTVNGNVRATLDLVPVGGPNSYAYLLWHFPANGSSANPTCAEAGVTTVEVSIDGAAATPMACSNGFIQPGVMTPYLAAGTHSIDLRGLDASGYQLYRTIGTLQTFAGNPVSSDYLINWAVGGAALKWQITDNSVGLTCGQAGISSVYVNFQDAAGNYVYGTNGDGQACGAAPVLYNYLQPGTYKVFLRAAGTGTSLYLSNSTYPPTVTVTAGQFVSSAAALNVQLFRVQ